MADKKKAGRVLMASLGRTKKEQMSKLYPKAQPKAYPKIKSKGPYTRGKVMGTGDLISRRAAVAGTKALRKADKAALRDTAVIGAAAAAGFGVGKYDSRKKSKAKTHKQKAKQLADRAIKKQKEKKEKHHSK